MISNQEEATSGNNFSTSIRIENPYTKEKKKKKNNNLQKKKKKQTLLHQKTNTEKSNKIKRNHRKIYIQPNSTLYKYFEYKTKSKYYTTDSTQPNTTSDSDTTNKLERIKTNIFENISTLSDSDTSISENEVQPTLTQLQFNNVPNTALKNRSTKAFQCRLRRIIRRKENPRTKEEIKAIKKKRKQDKEKKNSKNKNKETKRRKSSKLSNNNAKKNDPWGDPSAIPPLNSYRFASNNINGITYDTNCTDLQYICNQMDAIGADLVCLQETQLDTLQTKVRKTVVDTVKHFWRRSDVVTATSRINTGSINKPGGTMLISNNDMTSKVTRRYNDPMGRWAATSYSCIQGKNLTVVSCYQVCDKKDTDPTKGETTAFKQQ